MTPADEISSLWGMAAPRILVRSPNWIGDQVMAFPFYRALREFFPQGRLTLLCTENLATLDVPGHFEKKILLSRAARHSPRQIWKLARELRREGFDASISLTASFSSALLFFAARIPRRIGYGERSARWLLTDPRPWRGRGAGRHKSSLYRELLPEKPTSQAATGAGAARREELVIVAPGASIPLREWPYFRELLTELRARYPGLRIAVVGGRSDELWAKRLDLGDSLQVENWIGRTTLDELVALCRRARLVIANDSGVAHLAASLSEAPTLVLFGPGDPQYIQPLGPRVEAVRASGVACSPCESARCRAPFGYQQCLRVLGVDQVMVKVAAIL
jgi:heptosyltransferase-2